LQAKIVKFDAQFAPQIETIRICVFVEEQGVDKALDFDGRDEAAIHVLVNQQGKNIATARMLDDGHIGRIAVLKDYRGLGAGSAALMAMLEEARRRGFKRVYLGAQMQAKGFYLKKGFAVCGDIFMEAGIKHVEMEYYF
jgi:predicted GNAT family N-acyltransferase